MALQGKAAERSGWETLRALARNVELVKVMVANGVLIVAKMVVLLLVLPQLRSQIWSKDMAEFQAMVTLGLSLTAIVTSSYFGRFSDKFGRRAAAAVFGVCSFMPAWSVVVFGLNETGLYASCVGTVISGVGVNSNVLLVLASDVTDPADREVAFGAFHSVTMSLQFLLLGVPSLLVVTFEVISSNPTVVLVYQVALSILYFVIIASVRAPAQPEAASKAQEASQAPAAGEARAAGCAKLSAAASALVSPLRLSARRSLRSLAATFFLVAFSGDLLMDVGSQFFREALGLIPFGTPRQHQLVNVVSSLPSQLLVLPGYVAVGLLARRLGSLRLLLLLIPLSAGLLASGAGLLWTPEIWFVGVVTVAQAYGQLLNVPLQHLVTIHAPEESQGEVMGMMGACQQAANMLGNLAVIVVTPFLQKSGMENPLWVYYPAAGLVVFLAALPASGIGADAGEASVGGKKAEGPDEDNEDEAADDVDIEAPAAAARDVESEAGLPPAGELERRGSPERDELGGAAQQQQSSPPCSQDPESQQEVAAHSTP